MAPVESMMNWMGMARLVQVLLPVSVIEAKLTVAPD
jgi:hypothetical protein